MVICSFVGHKDAVTSCAFNSDNSLVISGSSDKTVKIWDITTSLCINTFTGHHGTVNAVSFIPNSNKVVSTSVVDMSIKIWSRSFGINFCKSLICSLDYFTGGYSCFAISPNGSYLITGTSTTVNEFYGVFSPFIRKEYEIDKDNFITINDYSVKLWNMNSLTVSKSLKGHTGNVLSCAFSNDNKTVISSSADKTIRIWNVINRVCIGILEGHKYGVTSVAFNFDSTKIVSGSIDTTVKVWDVVWNEKNIEENIENNRSKLFLFINWLNLKGGPRPFVAKIIRKIRKLFGRIERFICFTSFLLIPLSIISIAILVLLFINGFEVRNCFELL
jgi:WD40 repeat protein